MAECSYTGQREDGYGAVHRRSDFVSDNTDILDGGISRIGLKHRRDEAERSRLRWWEGHHAEYDYAVTMEGSQLSNIAFYIQSLGEVAIPAVIIGIVFCLDVNVGEANNDWGLSVLIAFASGIWLVLSCPGCSLGDDRANIRDDEHHRSRLLAAV
jgi:hypothetical protein